METAALVLGVFREAAHDEPDLTAIATRLERTVAREANGEKFVTAILAEIHTDEESIAFLNCGHPPPMIIRPDRSVDFPLPLAYALPIGIGTLGGDPPHPYRADFGPGEQLLLYTDGVTEARNAEGTFYPWRSRPGSSTFSTPTPHSKCCARTSSCTPAARTTTRPCSCCATEAGERERRREGCA